MHKKSRVTLLKCGIVLVGAVKTSAEKGKKKLFGVGKKTLKKGGLM